MGQKRLVKVQVFKNQKAYQGAKVNLYQVGTKKTDKDGMATFTTDKSAVSIIVNGTTKINNEYVYNLSSPVIIEL